MLAIRDNLANSRAPHGARGLKLVLTETTNKDYTVAPPTGRVD